MLQRKIDQPSHITHFQLAHYVAPMSSDSELTQAEGGRHFAAHFFANHLNDGYLPFR
jgi:hypothetical protein